MESRWRTQYFHSSNMSQRISKKFTVIHVGRRGSMRTIPVILGKIYFLLVALIPLLPSYVYGTFPSSRICNADGICFVGGGATINGETEAIFFLVVILLWPMCVWRLIGKHLLGWLPRLDVDGKSFSSIAAMMLSKAYWIVVAAIPILFWYMFATFLAPLDCAAERSCFDFYRPLNLQSKAVVFAVCLILWPLCALKLIRPLFRASGAP